MLKKMSATLAGGALSGARYAAQKYADATRRGCSALDNGTAHSVAETFTVGRASVFIFKPKAEIRPISTRNNQARIEG